jgi:signal peptidase I
VAAAVLALAVALLTTRVHGVSMSPALRDGDALLLDRVGVRYRGPQLGDVVVTSEPGGGSFVKRVIAVPGDAVEIDASGPRPVVLLQPGGGGPWRRLVEPYVGATWTRREFCCDARGLAVGGTPRPLRVPPGHVFLLGDNRDASTDSRRYGLFSTDQIVGRAVVRWWPLGRAGPIDGRPTLMAV